jgi:hypothetical protein
MEGQAWGCRYTFEDLYVTPRQVATTVAAVSQAMHNLMEDKVH